MKLVRFMDPSGYERTGRLSNGAVETRSRTYSREAISLLPPCTPGKIICIGLNYEEHAEETDTEVPDRPKLFFKGPNTVRGPNVPLNLPFKKKRVDAEAELGVVIDNQAQSIPRGEAMKVVRGFTCFNDLSNRTDHRQEQNWIRGKAFDGAAPIGPVLTTPDEVPADASIENRVNGELRQSSSRDRMIFDIPELIEEITRYLTLEPGDVIATGTPRGVEPLEDGDTVEISVEGIGTLRNRIHFSE
ncbi:MAG: fumarylacetoacetate hydrolase family protein [bacterium]